MVYLKGIYNQYELYYKHLQKAWMSENGSKIVCIEKIRVGEDRDYEIKMYFLTNCFGSKFYLIKSFAIILF